MFIFIIFWAGINKMCVRIANKEYLELGLPCLAGNYIVFEIVEHLHAYIQLIYDLIVWINVQGL